jgi:hypothetical protein
MASGDRTRYYWDKKLECLIEIRDGMNSQGPEKLVGPSNLIRDIDNYNAVGIQDPQKGPGHTLVITKGRRQHRDELRSRGMIEVGNDRGSYADKPKMPDARPMVREALSMVGWDNGARTIRELRRQGR